MPQMTLEELEALSKKIDLVVDEAYRSVAAGDALFKKMGINPAEMVARMRPAQLAEVERLCQLDRERIAEEVARERARLVFEQDSPVIRSRGARRHKFI